MTTSRTTSVLAACLLLLAASPAMFSAPTAHAQTPITWTSGTGNWNDASWDGFLTPTTVLGRVNGWVEADGVVANPLITINGPGSDVLYDAETRGDFRLDSASGGTGELLVSGGATLELRSTVSTGGVWSEIDAKGITVTGAGSKLSRTHTNSSLNGGAFIWGSFSTDPGEVIDIKVLDSAELDNEGQIWFGAYNDSAIDLTVRLKIDENASVKAHGALRGGISLDNTAGPLEGSINLIYNWDAASAALDDPTYTIDICGSNGMLTLDEFGVVKHEEVVPDTWTQTPMSFEDLWNDGILINSHSSDPVFANNFSVIGQPGDAFYKITNIEGIPEPSSFVLATLGLIGIGCRRRKQA